MDKKFTGRVVPIDELDIPEIFYKYRYFNNKHYKRGIFNCEIYIPSANEFNDPYDSQIPFRYKEEDLTDDNIYRKCLEIAKKNTSGLSELQYQEIAYNMQAKELLKDAHHLEKFDEITYKRLCNDYGIFCVTPDALNLLMWSYYADSHKGFCIGYDGKYLAKFGPFKMGGRIAYRNDFPKLPLFLTDDDNPLFKTIINLISD